MHLKGAMSGKYYSENDAAKSNCHNVSPELSVRPASYGYGLMRGEHATTLKLFMNYDFYTIVSAHGPLAQAIGDFRGEVACASIDGHQRRTLLLLVQNP